MKKLLVTLWCASGSALAAPVCDSFSKAVEHDLRQLSYFSEPVFGESASQELSRKMDVVAIASTLQMNIGLMQANKCGNLMAPINASAYHRDAFKCVMANAKAQRDRSRDPAEAIPECDREKWTRSDK